MLRVFVFEHDQDFLLLYAPDVAIVEVPDLEPPFTKESVSEAFRREGFEARVSQDVVGRELRDVLTRRRKDARSERAQKANLEQAAWAAEARGSLNPALREKAEVLQRKQEIDEELRQVKIKINEARRLFALGRYMDRAEWQGLIRREERLKQDSQACQVRMTEMRAERRATPQQQAQTPPTRKRLDRETYNAQLLYQLGRLTEAKLGREASEALFHAAKQAVIDETVVDRGDPPA
jgi:hypothetical protein